MSKNDKLKKAKDKSPENAEHTTHADKMFVLLLAIALGLFLVAVLVIVAVTVIKAPDDTPSDGDTTTEAPAEGSWYDAKDASFWYRYENDRSVAIAGYNYDMGLEIRVPSAYEGRAVTRIDDYAFLTRDSEPAPISVYIPKSVTSIGDDVFGNKTGFTVTYEGSEAQWTLIEKDASFNKWLSSCTIIFENK